jgi:pyruvate dehydrogenase (quinone)
VSDPTHVPRIVETAIREAVTKRGVAVIVISGDTALKEAGAQMPAANLIPRVPTIAPTDADVAALAEMLNCG